MTFPDGVAPNVYLSQLAAEILAFDQAKDHQAAVNLCRPYVALTAMVYGEDSLLAIRAASLLAISLSYLPERKAEAEAWAYTSFCGFVDLLMTHDAEDRELIPDVTIAQHISILRELFASVWDNLASFKPAVAIDWLTGHAAEIL